MSLTAADVAEIMRLVEQSAFDELTLEMDGVKLRLRRGGGGEGVVDRSGQSAAERPPHAHADQGSQAPADRPPHAPADRGSQAHVGPGPRNLVGSVPETRAIRPSSSPAQTSPSPPILAPAAPDPTLHDVAAPLLGTFYRAPKPGAPPFVEVGAHVEADTIVAIIEVMKLMNTVRAGVRGTVTEILVADGALVEYGEPLMRVRKAG